MRASILFTLFFVSVASAYVNPFQLINDIDKPQAFIRDVLELLAEQLGINVDKREIQDQAQGFKNALKAGLDKYEAVKSKLTDKAISDIVDFVGTLFIRQSNLGKREIQDPALGLKNLLDKGFGAYDAIRNRLNALVPDFQQNGVDIGKVIEAIAGKPITEVLRPKREMQDPAQGLKNMLNQGFGAYDAMRDRLNAVFSASQNGIDIGKVIEAIAGKPLNEALRPKREMKDPAEGLKNMLNKGFGAYDALKERLTALLPEFQKNGVDVTKLVSAIVGKPVAKRDVVDQLKAFIDAGFARHDEAIKAMNTVMEQLKNGKTVAKRDAIDQLRAFIDAGFARHDEAMKAMNTVMSQLKNGQKA